MRWDVRKLWKMSKSCANWTRDLFPAKWKKHHLKGRASLYWVPTICSHFSRPLTFTITLKFPQEPQGKWDYLSFIGEETGLREGKLPKATQLEAEEPRAMWFIPHGPMTTAQEKVFWVKEVLKNSSDVTLSSGTPITTNRCWIEHLEAKCVQYTHVLVHQYVC